MNDQLHKLGDVLRAAREAKGIDLPRVERETKIRTRYLSALERGDYRELPGAVYTKGFLRNYGTFLGLDPEYLVDLYHLETDDVIAERPPATPPRPLAVRPARAIVLTPGRIMAAILTVAVVAFVGYFVYEFVTFARTPDLQITSPVGDISTDKLAFTLTGTTVPNATVTVDGPRVSQDVTADAQGNFSVRVNLVPGSNLFSLTATDPVTHRSSPERSRTIDVIVASPSPSAAPIAITAPSAGASLTGPVEVKGTAPAGTRVRVTARLAAAAAPGFTIKTASGQAVSVPTLSAGTTVNADGTAGSDGSFTVRLVLPPGSWELSTGLAPAAGASPSATAAPSASPASPAPSGTPAVSGPTVAITVKAPTGLSGTLSIAGGPSYLLVLQDNVPLAGVSGLTFQAGKTVSISAKRSLLVRAGNAAAVSVTVNGIRIGTMGGAGQVVEWHITIGG